MSSFPKSSEASRGSAHGRLSTAITVIVACLNGSSIVDGFTVEGMEPLMSQVTSAITLTLKSGERISVFENNFGARGSQNEQCTNRSQNLVNFPNVER